MPDRIVELDGVQHHFPGDATDAEIAAALHSSAPRTDVHAISANEPDTFVGGAMKSLKDQFANIAGPVPTKEDVQTPWAVHAAPPAVEKFLNTPLAHPTGIDAIDNLTAPAGLAGLAAGAAAPLMETPITRGTIGRGLQSLGELDLTKPAKVVGWVGKQIQSSPTHDADLMLGRGGSQPSQVPASQPSTVGPDIVDRNLRTPKPTAAAPAPAAAASPAEPLSDLDLARQEVAAGRLPQSAVDALERGRQGPAPTPPGMIRGSLKPITVSPDSAMQPESPLQAPRVNVGAEVVGRQNGLSKEAVRQQTAPLFNEAPGDASPVVPQTTFERLHDKLLGMGPGNPEREAYVQSARDPKTAGQLEIMRRTLERNGLSVVGATSMAEAMRQAVLKRLQGDQGQ